MPPGASGSRETALPSFLDFTIEVDIPGTAAPICCVDIDVLTIGNRERYIRLGAHVSRLLPRLRRSEMSRIRFSFAPAKTIDAVSWMLRSGEENGKEWLDFHTILKTCYFADRHALAERQLPIFGAEYRAMNYGPVPIEIYEMLKCEPKWLMELAEKNVDTYPWTREDHFVKMKIKKRNDLEYTNIARAELNIVEQAFQKSSNMNFTQRTRETHEADWMEGTKRPRGLMHYEDMIPEDAPDREELIRDLQEDGFHYAL